MFNLKWNRKWILLESLRLLPIKFQIVCDFPSTSMQIRIERSKKLQIFVRYSNQIPFVTRKCENFLNNLHAYFIDLYIPFSWNHCHNITIFFVSNSKIRCDKKKIRGNKIQTEYMFTSSQRMTTKKEWFLLEQILLMCMLFLYYSYSPLHQFSWFFD